MRAKAKADRARAARRTALKQKKNANELLSYSNAKWVEKQKELDAATVSAEAHAKKCFIRERVQTASSLFGGV